MSDAALGATGSGSTPGRWRSEPLRGRGRRAWLFDSAVVVLAAAAVIPGTLSSDPAPHWLAALVALGLVAPLIVRRVWPVPVFAGMMVLATATGWFVPSAVVSAALLVALYTVASRCGWRATVLSAAALSAGVVGWTIRAFGHPGWRSAIILVLVVLAVTTLGLYMATRRRLMLELRARTVRLELERDQQGELAAAAERERIAREMHDIVAHHLTVMVALAEGAAAQSERAPQRAGEAMRTVSATGRQALADTRRLLGVVRTEQSGPARDPLPGLADLDSLLAGTRAAGLPVRYEVVGRPPELSSGRALVVYRLVQEALTNTMKHAGPGVPTTIRIRYTERQVELEIADDGLAATASAPRAGGRGLVGMRERVAAAGGTVTAGPRPGRGWTVRATVPVTGASVAAESMTAESMTADPGAADSVAAGSGAESTVGAELGRTAS